VILYRKIEATEVEGGLKLLPDEEIELAFEQGDGLNFLYFTNRRVIILEQATYRVAPYKDIIYYRVGQKAVFDRIPGVTINLPGESWTSRLELTIEEKYLIDVEYVLARHMFKYC